MRQDEELKLKENLGPRQTSHKAFSREEDITNGGGHSERQRSAHPQEQMIKVKHRQQPLSPDKIKSSQLTPVDPSQENQTQTRWTHNMTWNQKESGPQLGQAETSQLDYQLRDEDEEEKEKLTEERSFQGYNVPLQ